MADGIIRRHVDCVVQDNGSFFRAVTSVQDVAEADQWDVLPLVRAKVERSANAFNRLRTLSFSTPVVRC